MQKAVSPTEYRQQLRARIIKTAEQEFRVRGANAVKMDDIANILSISKRTLYEIFTNKEELLLESVKEESRAFDEHMRVFYEEDEHHNVMDLILEFYKYQMRRLSGLAPTYFADIHKFPPVIAWIKQKNAENRARSLEFFQKGVEQGYFRSDVDYELISKVGGASMDYVMSHQLYKRYSLFHLHRNVTMLYIRGLCTIKGIEVLDQKLAELINEDVNKDVQ